MGRLVAFEWVSLDGVFDADSMADWFFPYDSLERRKWILATYENADALLMGRETYEMLAPTWASLADDELDGLAGVLKRKPKFVASSQPTDYGWGTTTFFSEGVATQVERLKKQLPEILLIGSGVLAKALAKAGLMDEYHLFVHPFVMGAGRRFFDEDMHASLRLLEVKEGAQGILGLRYAVQK